MVGRAAGCSGRSCRALAGRVGLAHSSREHVGRHPVRSARWTPRCAEGQPRPRTARERGSSTRQVDDGSHSVCPCGRRGRGSAAHRGTSLHANGVPDPSYPPLEHRVAYLFNSGASPYQRHPELLELIPPELYERGRQLATRLAKSVPPTALLHGDLTPGNILDGGAQRGLVAIDPAPCLGDDLALEAIDLLLWQADDVDTIAARAKLLAPAIGADTSHLFEWCTAFAAMTALELAEHPTPLPTASKHMWRSRHRPRVPRLGMTPEQAGQGLQVSDPRVVELAPGLEPVGGR